jgi:hypothetical protein
MLITDSHAKPRDLDAIREAGVEVRVAEVVENERARAAAV